MKKLLFSSLALIMLAGLYSCENENVQPVVADELSSIDDPAFVIGGEEYEAEAVTAITLDEKAQFSYEEPSENFFPPKRPPQRGPKMDMRFILRKLDLTQDQLESVKVIMIDFHECQWTLKRSFYSTIKPKLDNANNLRSEIIAQLRNGEITREEAIAEIRQLNRRLHEALQPLQERLRNAMRNCHEEMIASIMEILDEDQNALFMQWLQRKDFSSGNRR